VTYNLDVEKGIGDSSMIDEDLNDAQVYRLGWNYVPAFNKRLMFRSSIDYGYYDYDDGRVDKKYGLSFLSEYKLKKWLKLVGGYSFRKRASTIKLERYNNSIVSLKLVSEF
ncbi:MAG: outer membrane beta-barrel protein, partial [Candidatus Omnitrophica bacterium]|nr:outer membrane beta-barrel protein [Candidatus Omnitrophota bacterium]